MPKIVTSSPTVTKYAMKASRTAAKTGPKLRVKGKNAAIAGAAGAAVATSAAVAAGGLRRGGSKDPATLNKKAVTADKVSKVAGYTGLAGAGLGFAAKQGAGMKVGGQVGHNVLSKSAKGLGAVGAIGTGAAVTAAYYANKRDKQMGVSKGTRRLNAAGTATGLSGVRDKSSQIKTASRVPKKGQAATKGRSQCKGNCQHR